MNQGSILLTVKERVFALFFKGQEIENELENRVVNRRIELLEIAVLGVLVVVKEKPVATVANRLVGVAQQGMDVHLGNSGK